jgi:hypothetical protein
MCHVFDGKSEARVGDVVLDGVVDSGEGFELREA